MTSPDQHSIPHGPPPVTVEADATDYYASSMSPPSPDATLMALQTQISRLSSRLDTIDQPRSRSSSCDTSGPSTTFYNGQSAPTQIQVPVPCVSPYVRQSLAPPHRPPRRPHTEKSHHRYYAVRCGINRNDVYDSWLAAANYCWDFRRNTFYQGATCRGFDSYDAAMDGLLQLPPTNTTIQSFVSSDANHTLPHEPPMDDASEGLSDLHANLAAIPESTDPPQFHHLTGSLDRCNNTTFWSHVSLVYVTQLDSESLGSTSFTDTSLPFLNERSETLLPKYSGKDTKCINEFIFKLQMFLDHPCIDICQSDASTNDKNRTQSAHLAQLLTLCITGNALSLFILDNTFKHKGIEMFHHLIEQKYPLSNANADAAYNTIYTYTMGTD